MTRTDLHNHALFRSSERYLLYRSLHFGTRGNAGGEYLLVERANGRRWDFGSQKQVNTYLAQAGEAVEWTPENEWREILGK